MTDPTQGDVVEDLEALAQSIRRAFPDVILMACPKCEGGVDPAVAQTLTMIRLALNARLDALAQRTQAIAARERARRAKAQ